MRYDSAAKTAVTSFTAASADKTTETPCPQCSQHLGPTHPPVRGHDCRHVPASSPCRHHVRVHALRMRVLRGPLRCLLCCCCPVAARSRCDCSARWGLRPPACCASAAGPLGLCACCCKAAAAASVAGHKAGALCLGVEVLLVWQHTRMHDRTCFSPCSKRCCQTQSPCLRYVNMPEHHARTPCQHTMPRNHAQATMPGNDDRKPCQDTPAQHTSGRPSTPWYHYFVTPAHSSTP
jgi:hypothetical protein